MPSTASTSLLFCSIFDLHYWIIPFGLWTIVPIQLNSRKLDFLSCRTKFPIRVPSLNLRDHRWLTTRDDCGHETKYMGRYTCNILCDYWTFGSKFRVRSSASISLWGDFSNFTDCTMESRVCLIHSSNNGACDFTDCRFGAFCKNGNGRSIAFGLY